MKAWNADTRCSALPRQDVSAYICFTRALLEHFNWELFDHRPYSPGLASSEYHLFTYRKNWLQSQRLDSNEKSMGDVKHGRTHSPEKSLTRAYKNVFHNTSTSVSAVTMLTSSLSKYVRFYLIIFLFACFDSRSPEDTFRMAFLFFPVCTIDIFERNCI
jgi:hypothetical protein